MQTLFSQWTLNHNYNQSSSLPYWIIMTIHFVPHFPILNHINNQSSSLPQMDHNDNQFYLPPSPSGLFWQPVLPPPFCWIVMTTNFIPSPLHRPLDHKGNKFWCLTCWIIIITTSFTPSLPLLDHNDNQFDPPPSPCWIIMTTSFTP